MVEEVKPQENQEASCIYDDVDIHTSILDSSDTTPIIVQPDSRSHSISIIEDIDNSCYRFRKRFSLWLSACSAKACLHHPVCNTVLWTSTILIIQVVVFFIGYIFVMEPSSIKTYPVIFRESENGTVLYHHVIIDQYLVSIFSQENGNLNKTANLNDFRQNLSAYYLVSIRICIVVDLDRGALPDVTSLRRAVEYDIEDGIVNFDPLLDNGWASRNATAHEVARWRASLIEPCISASDDIYFVNKSNHIGSDDIDAHCANATTCHDVCIPVYGLDSGQKTSWHKKFTILSIICLSTS